MLTYTYEESVKWMRQQSEHSELVKLCYLDEDNLAAAERFRASEEFAAVVKILNLDKLPNRLKILDLGCGNGIASYALASLGHDVFAVDPDVSEDVGLGATSKLASKISRGSISTFQSFAESLPFLESEFDIVYARQALHHFTDLNKGLRECSRVLKADGLLFATREHVINDKKQLEEFLESHILHKLHNGENAYPLKEYISNLKDSNFRILKYLAPYDNVINHFPTSNTEVKNWLFQSVQNKVGKGIAPIIIKLFPVETLYRKWLSHSCDSPGRLYSFLASNKKIQRFPL